MGSAECCGRKKCCKFVDDDKMNGILSRLVYTHVAVLSLLLLTVLIGCILGAQLVTGMAQKSQDVNSVENQIGLSYRISQACVGGLAYVNDSAKLPPFLAMIFDSITKFQNGQNDLEASMTGHLQTAVQKSMPYYNTIISDVGPLINGLPDPTANLTYMRELVWEIMTSQYQYSNVLDQAAEKEVSESKDLQRLVLILISVTCPLVFAGLAFELIFVFRPTVKMLIGNFEQFLQMNNRHLQAEQQLAQMSQNLADAVLQKWQTIVQYRLIFEDAVLKAEINYQTYVKLGFYFPHAKKAHEELASIVHKRTAQLDSMRGQLESSEKYADQLAQFKQVYDEHLSKRVAALKPANVSVESIMKAWVKEKRSFKEKNQVKLQGILSNILTFIMKNNLMEKILLRFSLFEVERGESLRFVLNRDLEEKNAMGLDGVDRVVLFGKRFHGLVKREHSTENWDFYRAVEEFKRTRMQIPQLGQAIYKRFLVHGAPDPVNLDSGTKSKIEKAIGLMIAGTKPWNQNVFDGAQSVIVELMASDSYKRFLRQAECAELYHELRKEETKAKEALLPLFKFAERLRTVVIKFCMECVKSGHYEQAQDLWADGMKLFEKIGPVCIPEADALLASCQHEYTRIQEIVARQDLAAADKRASKLLSMMERLKKEWIKDFLVTAREQPSVYPLLRVDAIHRLEKQLKAIERSLRDLKLRGDLVSVTRSSHEDTLEDSKAKESKTGSGQGDQKQHWYAQSIIQKEETEEDDKIHPVLPRSDTGDGDDDDDADSPRSGSIHDDTGKEGGKKLTDSPTKHARSVDIRDLYEDNKVFDGSPVQKEKSKNKKAKESSDKSLVTEYFKKLTKGKIDDEDDDISSSPKQKAQSKKGTMKKAELKVKPVTTTTKDKDKTYTRIPSPEPCDFLGDANRDDSLRSISVEDPSRIVDLEGATHTPRSVNSVTSDQSAPSPIKIMAIPEESRHSDDDTVTPSGDELRFTPNPLSDGVLMDSRPIK